MLTKVKTTLLARSCYRDGFYADSVSLGYYSILHAAKAALQLRMSPPRVTPW
ncbi:MAG TPA: hypothetical protein VJO34_04160 [Methylomirabilota bacterium]|nr:hypothetical protein [Methylomirabilota bacterium]